jgi:hypothetical protein
MLHMYTTYLKYFNSRYETNAYHLHHFISIQFMLFRSHVEFSVSKPITGVQVSSNDITVKRGSNKFSSKKLSPVARKSSQNIEQD